MVEIRRYTPFDKFAVLDLGKRMHAEAPNYQKKPFDDGIAALTIDNVAANGALFVAETNGELVGMIGGIVSSNLMFCEFKTAYALCHYVTPERRRASSAGIRLVNSFEDWAFNEMKVDETVLSPSTGVETEAVVQVYQKLGYKMKSTSLSKANPNVRP